MDDLGGMWASVFCSGAIGPFIRPQERIVCAIGERVLSRKGLEGGRA